MAKPRESARSRLFTQDPQIDGIGHGLVAGVIGMIPITPGGLGIVEASLTGLPVLSEVNSSQAVLATLTYRLASYWLPLCAGPIAYALFRIRYRSHPSSPAPRPAPQDATS